MSTKKHYHPSDTVQQFFPEYASPRSHVSSIIAEWETRLRNKYLRGQEEHGGKLWRKPNFEEMLDEITDLVIYASVLRDHLLAIENIASAALDNSIDCYDALEAIAKIIAYGNPEGE